MDLDHFFMYARERYNIFLKKESGAPKPWTESYALQTYRFCNVFREDDKVTRWFRDNVREPHRDRMEIGFACTAFRYFNLPSTAARLEAANLFMDWNAELAKEAVRDCKPLITGAYMIKTPLRKPKMEGICEILQPVWNDRQLLADCAKQTNSLEMMHHQLVEYPWIGPFMAYQAVCDMRFTGLLENAEDINTWTSLGPGSARGISRILYDNPDRLTAGNRQHNLTANAAMIDILAASKEASYWPAEWPQWELSTVQHWLCEYDKIMRVTKGEGTPKQLYNGI